MRSYRLLRTLALSFLVIIVIVAAINCGNGIPPVKAQPITQTYSPQTTATKAPTVNGDYWTAEASMPSARSDLGAAAVDGKIYAIGGRNGDMVFATNQQYNPATNTWTYKAPMPTPRYDFATAVYDGKIYCMGGVPTLNFYQEGVGFILSNVTEIYDPATDNWTTGAPMPQTSDGKANVVNGEIYVISGIDNPNIYLNQVYDPVTNHWSIKTPVPDRNSYCDAAAVIGDKIYVIGGNDFSLTYDIVQIYNTVTDSWTAGTSPPVYMGGGAKGAVTIGGPGSSRIDLIGLTGYSNPYSNGSNANQIYDPSTDSWAVMASMPTSRENFAMTQLGNEIYVLGGSIGYYPFPDDVGGSTLYSSANERYTLPAVIVMPTPTITAIPATNTTKTMQPTQSPPRLDIPAEGIEAGIIALFIVVAISVVLFKTRHRKSSKNS